LIWLIDISRLVENLHYKAPTGIDRVELAYALHFLNCEREDVRFIVTWPHFNGLLSRQQARPIIEGAAETWSNEETKSAAVLETEKLRSVLTSKTLGAKKIGVTRIGRPDRQSNSRAIMRRVSVWLRTVANRLSKRHVAEFRSKGAFYIHVSQFRLNRPLRFKWLSDASARSLFLLHDLIPVTHPEYCRPGEAERHKARVETMARYASVIVANSSSTRKSLKDHFEGAGRVMPNCEVIPLGVGSSFLAPPVHPAIDPEIPYFVVIGTIEPRKNLEFLLHVWREWMSSKKTSPARLVIVGRRGWENDNIINMLDRSSGLAASVIEVTSLSDGGMIALLRGATALLAPSFVEGFGLPIAEALALKVPVIASDIEAFREVGGTFVDYLNPLDASGWIKAFEDYTLPNSERRHSQLSVLHGYDARSWANHMQTMERVVADLPK
jgi:glycosyltransferase involved in cell wall biosynthesis